MEYLLLKPSRCPRSETKEMKAVDWLLICWPSLLGPSFHEFTSREGTPRTGCSKWALFREREGRNIAWIFLCAVQNDLATRSWWEIVYRDLLNDGLCGFPDRMDIASWTLMKESVLTFRIMNICEQSKGQCPLLIGWLSYTAWHRLPRYESDRLYWFWFNSSQQNNILVGYQIE